MFWNRSHRKGNPDGDARSAADLAMDRHADGDEAAFSELYDSLAPRLYAFALRQTRNMAASEDTVQQTMLRIHTARGEFVRGARVAPWAFAIAHRVLIDAHRRGRLEVQAEDQGPEPISQEASADDMVAARQTAAKLQAGLGKLSQAQRDAFALVKQEGLSHAEAAEALGTTVMAIKLRVHRAYEILRQAVGEEPNG
jgi:RNA polymerase sigma-70 factor (ECF subfamily)